MNILFIVENYPPHYGGVEIVFKNTCEGLVRRGHTVTLITHKIKNSPSREVMNGVNIIRVPCFESRYLFTFLATFYALKYARKADIIHTTTYNGAPPAWLAAQLTRKPVVITVHESWIGKWHEYTNMPAWKAMLHEWLERPIYWLRFNRYLTVSESTKKQLLNVLPKRLHKRIIVNHNGFDYGHWERKKHLKEAKRIRKELGLTKEFVVLGYGRPGFSKGFEYFVRAIDEIVKKIANVHIVLILSRDKAYLDEYNKLMKLLLPMRKHITVLDPVGYALLPSYLAMADCVVVPSLCEGFGYTTVEANAIGTPVVASNVASIPEVVSGKHVLVPPRDSQAIARGVVQVKKEKYTSTKKRIFSWKKNIERVIKTYEQLIK